MDITIIKMLNMKRIISIQTAINSANDGDTIEITGKEYADIPILHKHHKAHRNVSQSNQNLLSK